MIKKCMCLLEKALCVGLAVSLVLGFGLPVVGADTPKHLAPRSMRGIKAFLERYHQAMLGESPKAEAIRAEDERRAELIPPTARPLKKPDPRKVRLIAEIAANRISDQEIVSAIEPFVHERFYDSPEEQEMVEVLGQRYGLSRLRIPTEKDYHEVIKELHARAMAWHYLQENNAISPLEIYRLIKAFQEGLDPRIIFDVYLHLLGYEKGTKILNEHCGAMVDAHWSARNAEEGEESQKGPVTRGEENLLFSLESYLKPDVIEDHVEMPYVERKLRKWLSQQKEPTLASFVHRIETVGRGHDLFRHPGFPFLQMALSAIPNWDRGEEKIPQRLRSFARQVRPLLFALQELQMRLHGPEGDQAVYGKPTLELVDELAEQQRFFRSLDDLKKELKEIVLKEDRDIVDDMFELFTEEQLDVWHHAVRVAKLRYIVDLEMGVPREERRMKLQAALGHDWGKRDPDIAPYLSLERRLTEEETRRVGEHGARSEEIAQMLPEPLNRVVRLAMSYHNRVLAAKESEEFAALSPQEQAQAQTVLYGVYALDFLDALYDYARFYQRDRRPFDMGEMKKVLGWIERDLRAYRKERGKYAINPQVIAKERAALLAIAGRSTGALPGARDKKQLDAQFREVLQEAQPYWALYQLLKLEKQNYRLWNARTFKARTLDHARQTYRQKLWRSRDFSLANREALLEGILRRYDRVTEAYPAFPLELYLRTVLRFSDRHIYGDFEPELEKIRLGVEAKLQGKKLSTVPELRQAVIEELRAWNKSWLKHGPVSRYVAAMTLASLGDLGAMPLLAEALQIKEQSKEGPAAWKIRLAAVDALGTLYRISEKRLRFWRREDRLASRLYQRLRTRQRDWRERRIGKNLNRHEIRAVQDPLRYSESRLSDALAYILRDLGEIIAKDTMDPRTSPRVRQRALWVLRNERNPQIIPLAVSAMKDKSWRVRYLAVRILGNFMGKAGEKVPDSKVLDGIVMGLADAEGEIRQRTAQILIARGDEPVAWAILRALGKSDFDGRAPAMETIAAMIKKISDSPEFKLIQERQWQEGRAFRPSQDQIALLSLHRNLGIVNQIANAPNWPLLVTLHEYRQQLRHNERKLIEMLQTPSEAPKIARKKGPVRMDTHFKEALEKIATYPLAEWERLFVLVKKHVPKSQHKKWDKTWDSLKAVREKLHRREARWFRDSAQRAQAKLPEWERRLREKWVEEAFEAEGAL